MNAQNLSPIVLFVYNRPEETKRCLEALKKNVLAPDSHLIVFSDYSRDDAAENNVHQVREYLKNTSGFKKITIVERDRNFGLAASIIDGVTQIVNAYGRIIVLEDDLITSPFFLNYMNGALSYYEDRKKVWHINGWADPIDPENLGDTFLWRTMYCWGWATWANRWQHYEKNVEKTIRSFSKSEIRRLNLNGSVNFWRQIMDNKNGKINSWAIFWYTTIFKHNGLCLTPSVSFVKNIGFGVTGTNCPAGMSDNITRLNENSEIQFEDRLVENTEALVRIIAYRRQIPPSLVSRISNKIRQILGLG